MLNRLLFFLNDFVKFFLFLIRIKAVFCLLVESVIFLVELVIFLVESVSCDKFPTVDCIFFLEYGEASGFVVQVW